MNYFSKQFQTVHTQLRGAKRSWDHYLEQVRLENFRGIASVSVDFDYPVSVIAGPNASGKTTLLFACACAYKVAGAGPKDFTPSTLFPNLKTSDLQLQDPEGTSTFEYHFKYKQEKHIRRWRRTTKNWNKSGVEKERPLVLRLLSHLTNPSEVRSVLQIAKTNFSQSDITLDTLTLAHAILPMSYTQVIRLQNENKDLLFAVRDEASYSEFHMSSGERRILRLFNDISRVRDALILIDEIEVGLHPYTQTMLMLELQRLALRNHLQIIITTHSPVILDAVPLEGRIFLERKEDNLITLRGYRPILQKALYGQSLDKINILCEDNIGEAVIRGVMMHLNVKLNLIPDDIVIGRDTGKDSFKNHIEALGKFRLLGDFIFVLDGDAQDLNENLVQTAWHYQTAIKPLFLPGRVPEIWLWQMLIKYTDAIAEVLGLTSESLKTEIQKISQLMANAGDKPTQVAKSKYQALCDKIQKDQTALAKDVTYHALKQQEEQILNFTNQLEDQLQKWLSKDR
jgi:predicted ATPase